jgi:hypothetical protein
MTERQLELAEVAKLARRVTLDSVCWREVGARRIVEQAHIPSSLTMSGSHDATGLRDIIANQIVVVAEFRFFASGESGGERVAEISGRLALRYSVAGLNVESIQADLVNGFARSNGLYNAWPYWRELVQNTGSRIGIHGVIAPVFRLTPAAPKEGATEEQASTIEGGNQKR